MTSFRAFLILALAACCGAAPARAETRALKAKNSIGRAGSLYVPSGAGADKALPLLVAFHGSGGSGTEMIGELSSLADSREFLILAVDSRRSPAGELTWEVGTAPGMTTEDLTHAADLLKEVRAMSDIAVDSSRVLALGYSGGGSMAPYAASRLEPFTAFAVLHGGAVPGGLGTRRPRGWFSTGSDDTDRPPDVVRSAKDSVAASCGSLQFRTFPGGHTLSDEEKNAVVDWWLGP